MFLRLESWVGVGFESINLNMIICVSLIRKMDNRIHTSEAHECAIENNYNNGRLYLI